MKKVIFILALCISFNAQAADGKALFTQICASCHGMEGAGDGPVGKALPEGQRPANMQIAAFKFAKDETKFIELLQKGGAGVGLNPIMPAQAQLKPDEVKALYTFVKSLKK